jgi:hypothetical protein
MNHYHDVADRAIDPVYKQHLQNYANAIDATKCAADAYCALEPEDFVTTVEYQNRVNELFRYLLEAEKEQIEACTALNLYKNRELIRMLQNDNA